MSPQPTDKPPTGHSRTTVSLRETVIDRWGCIYHLEGRIAPAGCEFSLARPGDRPVARITLEVDGMLGQLTALHVAGDSAPWLPPALKPLVRRLLPSWSGTGHRGRGLGSLLVIYALKTACNLGLISVTVAPPIPAPAQNLLRDLGFLLAPHPTGVGATYHILTSAPR